MLHGAIFLATCNAILLLTERCKITKYESSLHSADVLNISKFFTDFAIKLTSLKSRIALQVARKIAPSHDYKHDYN
jgi:hypothetical protein